MKMVEVGMQVNVEVGEAEEKNKKYEETDGSSEVVHWERVLPRMVLRVLLVEADDSTRQIIAALLRKCSYKVAAVSDGLKAWETLKDQPHSIDLILTAVELPSISGFALLSLVMEHDICKHIPVIMMSSEDSFSMVVKCMLKGAADFLIKPVRRNELRNLWQHVWRRRMLAGGCTPHNLHTTDENNAESNQSSDHRSSTPKTNGESDTQDHSQWKYTSSSNLSDTGRELQGNVVKLGQESLQNEGRTEGISDKLFVSGNSKRFVKEVARCNDTCESIASKLEENSAFVKGMAHDDAIGLQSDRENANVMIGVGCNEKFMESSTEAIDFIGSFDMQPMGAFAVSGLTDGAKKFDISPQLELSLRRSCLSSSNNHGTSERHILNHSDASAFSRYNSSKSLQPNFPTLAGNREEGDSKRRQDLESNNDTSQSHVGTLGDSWENLPNPVKSQSETSSNSRLGPFSVTGARINIMSAGSNTVFPYHAQSGLPPACSPKQDGKQEYSPLPASTSVHSDPDIHDSKQGNHWPNEATNSSVDQSVQGQNKKEPVEELRCSSLIDDQGTCSHIYNDVTNHEKSCAHGGDFSRSNASGGAPLAASIDRGTTTESFDDGNRFLHDGLKGMDANRLSQREAALTKFRLKRKDRCFEKKVRYQNRKRLAEQRPRVKGQFVRQVQNDPPVDDSDSPKI